MGAFFLHHAQQPIDAARAAETFARRGFDTPRTFALGGHVLHLYRKQCVDASNAHQAGDAAVFAIGSPVYRGAGYPETLRLALSDWLDGRLDPVAFRGNYALIFHRPGAIQVLTDAMGVQHLFMNADGSVISSSFLAVLAASPAPLPLNREAWLEKLATGYVMAPDTLVSGILRLTPATAAQIADDTVSLLAHRDAPAEDVAPRSLKAAAEWLADGLVDYYRQIAALATEYPAELGLSGGFDSRMVLALARRSGIPVGIHTHQTGAVHDADVSVARHLAGLCGIECRAVTTTPFAKLDGGGIDRVMADSLSYYDGRTSDNTGACSETFTRAYRMATLGAFGLTLNGIGGEIYRNFYHVGYPRVSGPEWLRCHLFYCTALPAMRQAHDRDAVTDRVLSRIAARLGCDMHGRVSPADLQRFFGDIYTPENDGINHNAHNQLGFFLTPFVEPVVNARAYACRRFLGVSGDLQGAIIAAVDPELAAVPSRYGYSFTGRPLSAMLKEKLRSLQPLPLLRSRIARMSLNSAAAAKAQAAWTRCARASTTWRQGDALLRAVLADVDLDTYICEPRAFGTAAFLGRFLHEYRDRLAL